MINNSTENEKTCLTRRENETHIFLNSDIRVILHHLFLKSINEILAIY